MVRRANTSVYHVVVAVGAIVGAATRDVGTIATKTTDLVVFTLAASQRQLKSVTATVNTLARKTTEPKPRRRTKK